MPGIPVATPGAGTAPSFQRGVDHIQGAEETAGPSKSKDEEERNTNEC